MVLITLVPVGQHVTRGREGRHGFWETEKDWLTEPVLLSFPQTKEVAFERILDAHHRRIASPE